MLMGVIHQPEKAHKILAKSAEGDAPEDDEPDIVNFLVTDPYFCDRRTLDEVLAAQEAEARTKHGAPPAV